MATDVLGPPYECRTIDLGGDSEGPVTATLVRRMATGPAASGAAVLYVHGFADYFFQKHLADFYVANGFSFYALDLRKCGRSLASHQTPHQFLNITDYYLELDEAVRSIREADGHERLVLNGHSLGGLVAALWAHDRRDDNLVDGLFLNSPFLDLDGPWIVRRPLADLVTVVGRTRPNWTVPFGLNDVYGRSIHGDHNGEWRYNLEWKPLNGFPVTTGWTGAVRAAQRRVHAGLDLDVPVLVATSTRSCLSARWSPQARTADTVLDVKTMARWAPSIGGRLTLIRIDNGLHDLTLSPEPARQHLFTAVGRWLSGHSG